jgi:holin-like protein
VPLPVPASVWGLVIMLIALLTGVIKVAAVRDVAAILIEYMPLMFIPAAVGLIDVWPLPARLLIAAIAAIIVVTLIVMAVTGHAVQWVQRRRDDHEVITP